ncbi:MAG: AAA family ATPase, partial [Piscirickettsiaceae bacterium CG_4_10_14_3_um_filter_44_349]
GAYPFYQESLENYPLKLLEVINHTIDVDLTSLFHIDSNKLDKLKKIYIELMQSADLLYSLRGGSGMRAVNKPDKLLLNNPNLFQVLCANPNTGSLRESFFVSQLSYQHQVHYHDQGDFLVNDQYIF